MNFLTKTGILFTEKWGLIIFFIGNGGLMSVYLELEFDDVLQGTRV